MTKHYPLWATLSSLYLVAAASSFAKPNPGSKLRVHQVTVVHRHGDRTPITPMRDAEYWQRQLPAPQVLDGIAKGTTLVRPPEGGPKKHGAAGRGPFGQLTMVGALQMISLGERLKEELEQSPCDAEDDDECHPFVNQGRLFTLQKPLIPSRVKCMSTDFPRTIQSAQALLTGLFPGAQDPIEIGLKDTNSYLIPDPQPRQWSERQLSLERYLSRRPHVTEKEAQMRELARRVTNAVEGHLGAGAQGVSFGIGEEKDARSTMRQPLAWAQLAEILVCLNSRELLPPTLSQEDVEAVSNHVAWRWKQTLGHPVLAKAAMSKFASQLVDNMQLKIEEQHRNESKSAMPVKEREEEGAEEPGLCLYSAHDSTLIGLLCVLQLEHPAEWPEYGSFLKIELLREVDEEQPIDKWWVRFSLNGQELRSMWLTDDGGEPASMVPLNQLTDMIHSEHELKDEGSSDPGLKYSWKGGMLIEH